MILLVLLLVVAAPLTGSAASDESSLLITARQAYNDGRYDEAIAAARRAIASDSPVDAARLVLARALIERYRQRSEDRDLTEAREVLQAVDDRRLQTMDRGDLLVALGQVLYFGKKFGAAAELFDAALAQPRGDNAEARDRALDWWATALDRQAQNITADRDRIYARMLDRMQQELRMFPGSVAANYWLPAAARGVGDLDRAWQAAMAGWVRAALAGVHRAALRADLDRLVVSAIIPDRAREIAVSRPEQRQVADGMTEEWKRLKAEWGEQ